MLDAARAGLESNLLEERLATVTALVEDGFQPGPDLGEVNNHVHTRYSFSPYSPTAAVCYAAAAGLRAVGSVDHDSIGAASETVAAAAMLGIGSTVGCEVRVGFAETAFGHLRLNNPDSIGNAYIVLHGVPESGVAPLARRLEPITAAREARNRRQVQSLNAILAGADLAPIDYDGEVRPLSWVDRGGSVTERHIFYALAIRLERQFGRGSELLDVLTKRLGLTIAPRQDGYLRDPDNPHFLYDLLGVFKSGLVDRFFEQPNDQECPSVREICDLALQLGAIPAYSYLGDVGESPTGDKKAQAFEDAFIDELFAELHGLGFRAVTYMPPRNTLDQLKRVQRLAAGAGLLQISGVDINSSRQSFRCPEVLQPAFRHLNRSTWALIAHEKLAAGDPTLGLFHEENPLRNLPLADRVERYAAVALSSDLHNPLSIARVALSR